MSWEDWQEALEILTDAGGEKVPEPLDCMITGIEGNPGYFVYSSGQIVTTKRGVTRELNGTIHKRYKVVSLRNKHGKFRNRRVHRIVATAFLPNPLNKPEVNHKNGVKLNNSVHNLEWVSGEENYRHSLKNGLFNNNPMAVLSYSKSGKIIRHYASMMDAERDTGVSSGNISLVCQGKRHAAGGIKWSYI